MKNPHTPNLTWIGSWWSEICPHEYLISPTEISVNWSGSKPGLVHNCLEPDQFTLISMGLIRYSCGHISSPHEPIPTQFGLWMFFIMLHRYMVSKTLKSKKVFCDVIASVLYLVSSLTKSQFDHLVFSISSHDLTSYHFNFVPCLFGVIT